MKKNILISSGIIITIGLFYFLDRDISPTDVKRHLSENVPREEGTAQMMVSTITEKPEPSISSITEEEMNTFRSSYPDKFDVQTEVTQDPHATPQSLINFAKKVGPLYEKALQNKNDATSLVDAFNECVLDDSVAQTARALCLSSAEKLAEIYPDLEEKTLKMRELAPSEVSNLVENKKLLKNK